MSNETKSQILFHVSIKMKDALGQYAQSHDKAVSEIIRVAVAKYIGFDLTGDPIVNGRPRIYANKEERLEAQRTKAKQERATLKQLISDYEHEKHMEGVNTLEEWLERRAKRLSKTQ